MIYNFISNKKSQAQIISTILIILLVLAAVVIVWQVVQGTVKGGSEEIETQIDCLGLNIDITAITTASLPTNGSMTTIVASTNITNTSRIETWNSTTCTTNLQNVPHPSCIITNSSSNVGVQASDNSRLLGTAGVGTPTHLFKYKFESGRIDQIINVSWKWEGLTTGVPTGNASLYIFNDSNNNWSIFSSTTSSTDVVLEYFTKDQATIRNIFNDTNYTQIIGQHESSIGFISTDFVTLTLNHDTNSHPNPASVTIRPSKDLSSYKVYINGDEKIADGGEVTAYSTSTSFIATGIEKGYEIQVLGKIGNTICATGVKETAK